MTKDFEPGVIEAIRKFYQADEAAQALFDWAAQRERDASFTSIDRICRLLDVSRGEAVALARELEVVGCGEFIVGRRGQKSRFQWNYSCISLGQAASGEASEIEELIDPTQDDDEDLEEISKAEKTTNSQVKMTIPEAKEALSAYFGVPTSNIEIMIKG